MTGNIFLDLVFLFLICYSLVKLFRNLSDFLLKRYCNYPQKTFLCVEIKHKSETIECDIRCAVSKSVSQKCALVVICSDLDLSEQTLVWRLTDSYDNVILTDRDGILKILDIATSISMLK